MLRALSRVAVSRVLQSTSRYALPACASLAVLHGTRLLATDAKTTPPPTTPASPAAESVLDKEKQTLTFKAETQKLLDIVARSLYSEKEVFIRELISNASDALEKVRRLQGGSTAVSDPSSALEIRITVDAKAGTFTIQDTGCGMSDEDLKKNLGTIAHSGTSEFIKTLGEKKEDTSGLIGRFGVGFYSTFMVGSEVTVYSRPAVSTLKDGAGWQWHSNGVGSYSVSPANNVSRGTKIIIKLKEDEQKAFADVENVRRIIETHSNFVSFPVLLNGTQVNTLPALWSQPIGTISKEDHTRFYKFIAKAMDEPRYDFHFAADAPLSIRALFYVPSFHLEKYGLMKLEPGVSLFSRKVLVQHKCKFILPEWLRFVRGVVDSEDVPLNLSRELLQNNGAVMRLKDIVTKRILKFFNDEAKKDRTKYNSFFDDFGMFLKEGLLTDQTHRPELAKLMRFASAKTQHGDMISLEEYVNKMVPNQKSIYYLMCPNRNLADASPYYEAYSKAGVDVLFLYTAADEFVMHHLVEFSGKRLVSVESSLAGGEIDGLMPKTTEAALELPPDQLSELSRWLQNEALNGKISEVNPSRHLSASPAVIVDHQPASFRAMMKLVDVSGGNMVSKHKLELNARHPLILRLFRLHKSHPHLAREVAEQMFDNCLVSAGIMEDPRAMLHRINRLMLHTVDTTLAHSTAQDINAAAAAPSKEEADKAATEKKWKLF